MVAQNNMIRFVLLLIALPIAIYYMSACEENQATQLSVKIVDKESGLPTPVRVRLTDLKGVSAPLPKEAIGVMYGRNDAAEGYAFQPDSAFYVDGAFTVELKPGKYRMILTKGFEYITQQHEIDLKYGEKISQTIFLERWINMPDSGWYSADDHIHIRRSPRENPFILKWVAAEDIHVGALLQMGDFWTTYYAQYAWGKSGVYQLEDHLLTSGQEDPRTHEIGHTILLTHDSSVRFSQDYYSYDRVFDRIHELDGLTGYAHQGMSFHGYRGMTLDVLQGKVDFLELLQFCVEGGPLHFDHYYHFLDLGYRLTATAGSDFPWCGKSSGWDAQIGNARFYTYVGDTLTFNSWKENFKAGHTFVSSGPMLDLKVNGIIPGNDLDVDQESVIKISAVAYGHPDMAPLQSLEIISHGEVIGRSISSEPGQSSERVYREIELQVKKGQWIAARCQAGDLQVAHTTPVYVTINEGGIINPVTASRYLDLSEQYLQELEAVISERDDRMDSHAWRYKEELEERISETRVIIEDIRDELNPM
jgi:hypothetical protein